MESDKKEALTYRKQGHVIQTVWDIVHTLWHGGVCHKTGSLHTMNPLCLVFFSECLVLVTVKWRYMVQISHPASLLYPGTVCWKVWTLQTSLNKQISPGRENLRNTGKHQHHGKWAPIGALKNGLFCAEMAAPTWPTINVVVPRLFSSCEAFLSQVLTDSL